MRFNTFIFASLAIIASSSHFVKSASIDVLNEELVNPLNLEAEVDSAQSLLRLEKRRASRRALKHPHPHPHPSPQPQPPNNGGGNGGNGGNGGQPSCSYDQNSGMLTEVTQDGCPSQITPGTSGCTINGSSGLISANVLQYSVVSILGGANVQKPQDCTVQGSNGGLITVQALQCSAVGILSIINSKPDLNDVL